MTNWETLYMLFTPMLKASDDITALITHNKAELLVSTFFSSSLITNLLDIVSATYLISIYFLSITAQEVIAAVKQVSLNKISESDKISSVTDELRKKFIYHRVEWVQMKLTELLLSQDSCERIVLLHFQPAEKSDSD